MGLVCDGCWDWLDGAQIAIRPNAPLRPDPERTPDPREMFVLSEMGTRARPNGPLTTTNITSTTKATRNVNPTTSPACTRVFFANERTFLSWLNFTVVLGGLAVGLLNFGDQVGQISAGLFTLVAMGVMIYALITFHWRANAIRKRGSGNYDDRIGPTALCIALLIAVITNFILRFTA